MRILRVLAVATILILSLQAYASCELEEDTAAAEYAIGPFNDSTDFSTETALTINQADVQLMKNGQSAFAQKNDANVCTHRGDGFYTCPLNATDTDTAGNMLIQITVANVLQVWEKCFVKAEQSYDIDDGTDALHNFDPTIDAVSNIVDKSGYSLLTATLRALAAGTAQAGTANTIQLAASETFADNTLNGNVIKIVAGTGSGQHAGIIGYVSATDTATIYGQGAGGIWVVNPDVTSVYEIVEGSVNAQIWNGVGISTALQTGPDLVSLFWQEPLANHSGIAGSTAATLLELTTDTGNIITQIAAVDGAVGALPTANQIRDAVLDAAVDGAITVKCAIALSFAVDAGPWSLAAGIVSHRNVADDATLVTGTITEGAAGSFSNVTHACPP